MSSGKRKQGRPKKDDPRNTPFTVKLNEKEIERLMYLSETYEMTTAEIFRLGIKKLWDDI